MQNDVKIKVMVAGHICLDITPQIPFALKGKFDEILVPGKLVNVDNAVISTGGAVSNTGLQWPNSAQMLCSTARSAMMFSARS